jgi:hypothetical protein
MPLGNSVGIGANNVRVQRVKLSPQAISYKSRIIANGGTIDDFTIKIIDDNLIKPMLTSGIWDCMDKLHLYAGHQNSAAARVNLINSSYTATDTNGSVGWLYNFGFYALGTTSATSGYLTFGYNPATAPKWSADRFNCSQFLYLRHYNNSTAVNLMGTGTATASSGAAMKRAVGAGNFTVFMNHTATTAINSPVPTGSLTKVWLCGTRTANTVKSIIDSSANTYTIAPTATILSQDLSELTILGNSGGTTAYDINGHLASGHGNNNYDNQLLRTYISNTLTALGI